MTLVVSENNSFVCSKLPTREPYEAFELSNEIVTR
jgi:hypothetical protein